MKVSKNIRNILTSVIITSMMIAFGSYVDASSRTSIIKGNGRVETSIESSKLVNSKVMVVASGYSFPDSLSAYNIASSYNAKLILVNNNTDLTEVLDKVEPEKVYLIGGINSLSGNVVESICNKVSNVIRISGNNRYETNEKTLKESRFTKVGVADGRNYPDALAASSLLKNKGLGLLLVDGARPYISNREVVYTYGGKNSVKQNGGKRLAGTNRYATSEMINKELGSNIDKVAITTGENYADALSSINLVNSGGKVSLMLVKDLDIEQKKYLSEIPSKYIIGGQLSNKTISEISSEKNFDENSTLNLGEKIYNCSFIDISGESIDNSDFEVDDNNLIKIEKKLPNKYKIVSDKNEIKNIKPNGEINKIYVAKQGLIVLKNQDEYNRYIFEGLKNGIDNEEVLVGVSVRPNKNLERIADGMGFTLNESLLEGNSSFNKMKINMSIRQEYYTKEIYNKREYAENMKNVEVLIKNSGANNIRDNRQKALRFAQYLKVKYPYNNNVLDHIRARSPYSITKYNTGVCEGFTYTYNQGMLLMGIPAYQVEGTDINGKGHMESMVYCDGRWEDFNVSGYTNWYDLNHNDLSQVSESDIEQSLVYIENDPYSEGLVDRINKDLALLYRI